MDFQHLPKIELHLHLDCSLSYDVVRTIDSSISVEEYNDRFIAPPKCANLADFLKRAPEGFKLMQTEEQLRLVVDDLFEQLAADNVVYAEIRFAPLQHIHQGLLAHDVVGVVEEATAKAIARTGIQAGVILCTLRHFSEDESMETVKLVRKFAGTKIVGFDIAADEAGFPIYNHVNAFRYAYDEKIHCTAHAGEARGPESMWETLEHFRPSRIGHGVRSIEDPILIERLKKDSIHLEVCPSCNVQIDIFESLKNHSVRSLYEQGVSVGINTDARTITNVTLTKEYQRLHDAFGWTREHFLRCNLNAAAASFTTPEQKLDLSTRLESAYRD